MNLLVIVLNVFPKDVQIWKPEHMQMFGVSFFFFFLIKGEM